MFCLLVIVVFSPSDIKEHLMVYGARSNGDLSGESVDPGCDSDHSVQHDTDQGETRTSDKNSLLPDLWPWAHANVLCYSRTHSNHLTSFTRSLKFYIRSEHIQSREYCGVLYSKYNGAVSFCFALREETAQIIYAWFY